jgi:hypothetical protein
LRDRHNYYLDSRELRPSKARRAQTPCKQALSRSWRSFPAKQMFSLAHLTSLSFCGCFWSSAFSNNIGTFHNPVHWLLRRGCSTFKRTV